MMTRYNRSKLRAHDSGVDRHNKGVALLKKQTRLEALHNREIGRRGIKRLTRPLPVTGPEPEPTTSDQVWISVPFSW